ncbi:MAG: hypothetical protein WCV99_12975 [Sterolibacterium sp.]
MKANASFLMRALLFALALLPLRAQALERDITNALQTVGGTYSSIYIHEFGHALAFKAFGATAITIEVPPKGKILGGLTTAQLQTPLSPGQRQINAVSGLLASSLAGEFVLQRRSLHHSPYAQAVLGTAVLSNLRHTYTYYTRIVGRDGYTGNDIDYFEQAGGNPHLFSAALITYAAWTLQRMKKEGIPLFYVDLHF